MEVIRTTLTIPQDIYKQFCLKVLEQYGTKHNNDVVVKLIEDWIKQK